MTHLPKVFNENVGFLIIRNASYSGEVYTEGHDTSGALVSNHALFLFQWICFAVLCQIIGVFGTTTNIINIICFIKQGFKDPVNVSLLGLAISDMGCLLTLIWLNVGMTPVFQQADLPFSAVEIEYLTGGWPHVACTRITSWVTALITLERCLCITVPLKVKTIVTSRRICVIVVCIFIILIGSVAPVYCVNTFAMKFYPEKNKTILGLVYTENRDSVEKITFAVNNVFVPFTAFLVIVISTATLVIQLQRKITWRKVTVVSRHSDSGSNPYQVSKMVVIISTLFIACFTPVCVIFLGMILEPGLAIDGKYRNLFIVISGICFILESTNSSVNIFIYYRMSSKYRTAFRQLFHIVIDT